MVLKEKTLPVITQYETDLVLSLGQSSASVENNFHVFLVRYRWQRPGGHLLILPHGLSYPHLPRRLPRGQTSIASRSNFSSCLLSEMCHEKKGPRIAIPDLRSQHVSRTENFPLLALTFHMKHFVKEFGGVSKPWSQRQRFSECWVTTSTLKRQQ